MLADDFVMRYNFPLQVAWPYSTIPGACISILPLYKLCHKLRFHLFLPLTFPTMENLTDYMDHVVGAFLPYPEPTQNPILLWDLFKDFLIIGLKGYNSISMCTLCSSQNSRISTRYGGFFSITGIVRYIDLSLTFRGYHKCS